MPARATASCARAARARSQPTTSRSSTTWRPGVFVAADSNHGYKMIAVGREIARVLGGGDSSLLYPFRFERFADRRAAPGLPQPLPLELSGQPAPPDGVRRRVVRPSVPELRRPRGDRLRLRRRGVDAPGGRRASASSTSTSTSAATSRACSASGGITARAAARGSSPSATRAPTRCSRWRCHEPRSTQPAGRADRPLDDGLASASTARAVTGLERRHDRLGAVRGRRAHVLAQLQVPPPPRPDVLRRPVPQLPGRGRRRARRARLRRAAARGHAGRAPERDAVAVVRRDARDRPVRRAVHAARLLLQDVHQAAPAVAAVRAHPADMRRASAGCRRHQEDREWATALPPPPRRRAGRRRRGAGLAAASPRRDAGADAVLVDEGPEPGGRLLWAAATSAPASWRRRARGRRRDPLGRCGARLVRRHGAGLAGRHAAPDPRGRGTSSRPARSRSRSCSPATTCPA